MSETIEAARCVESSRSWEVGSAHRSRRRSSDANADERLIVNEGAGYALKREGLAASRPGLH